MDENPQYVVCITDRGDEVSVVKGKLYRVAPAEPNDPPAAIRVVDEAGEDYLYDRAWFAPIDVPQAVAEALMS